MKLGAILGVIETPDNPRALAEQARLLVSEGFESLWAAQSVGRGFIYPDPLMVLTVAASVTEDILLGTAIVQVPLYHPMDLAHRIFCLRQIAADRLIVGVGVGSTKDDFDALDRNYENRFRDFKAGMQDLRKILETGRHGASDLTPWPHTLGTQRVFLGTWGKGVLTAAREYDGWIASAHYRSIEEIEAAAAKYHQAGGGTSVVSTTYVSARTDLGELKEKFQRFCEIGFDHAVAIVMPGGPSPAEVRQLVP